MMRYLSLSRYPSIKSLPRWLYGSIVAKDANVKLNTDYIPGDQPHPLSNNGKLLSGMIERQKLTIVIVI